MDRGVLAVVGLALALRLANLGFAAAGSPFFGGLNTDERAYHEWALAIAGGRWVGDEVFFLAPLFPYALGLVYALVGAAPLAMVAVQAVLSAFTAGLVALVGVRLVGRRAGLAAGVLAALHGPLVFFTESLLSETLHLCLAWGGLALFVRARDEGRGGPWLRAGLLLGLAAAARAYFLLPLGLLALLALRRGRVPAARLAGGAALALAPCLAHNLAAAGDPVLVTASAGANLVLGNHAGATGRYHPPPGLPPERIQNPELMRESLREVAEREAGRPLAASRVSAHWRGVALRWIAAHPLDWLALTARKLAFVLEAYEYPGDRNYYQAARWSPVLRWTPGRWPLLLALAGVGLAAGWRRRAALAPVLLLVAAGLFVLLAFYVTDRFRLVLVPPLCVLGGAGVDALAAAGGRRRWALAGLGAALFALSLGLSWGRPLESSMSHYNLAVQHERRGELERAEEELRASIALQPRGLAARNLLVEVLLRQGRRAEAQRESETLRDLAREKGIEVRRRPNR